MTVAMVCKQRKCIIYVRVSTEDQMLKGFSIPGQIEDCMKRAIELGYKQEEVVIIQDDESGADINRTGLTRLRENIKTYDASNIAVDLIMYDPDRFARNLKDQLVVADEMEGYGATLIFINIDYNKDSPESMMFFQLRGIFSQYERTKIKQRTSMGRLTKVKKTGKFAWNLMTYGYNFNQDTDELDINEEQANVIKMIFNWLVYGDETETLLSCNKIAKKLATMGIPTPKVDSKFWHTSTVLKVVKNEIYCGIYWAYKTKSVDGVKIPQPEETWLPIIVPKLIEKDLFDKAQIRIAENANKCKGRSPDYDYLLRGLVYCGRCGSNMIISVSTHKHKTYRYYACNNKMHNSFVSGTGEKEYCHGKIFDAVVIDAYVWGEVVKILSNPDMFIEDIINVKEESIDNISLEIKTLNNELTKVLEKEEGLVKLFMSQRVTLEMFDKMKLELDNKKTSLVNREKELKSIIEQKAIEQEQRGNIVDLLQNMKMKLENPDSIDASRKIKIVRQLIKRIVLFDDGKVRLEGMINFDKLPRLLGDVHNWHKELRLKSDVEKLEDRIWKLYKKNNLTYVKIGEKLGISKGQVDYRIRKIKGVL